MKAARPIQRQPGKSSPRPVRRPTPSANQSHPRSRDGASCLLLAARDMSRAARSTRDLSRATRQVTCALQKMPFHGGPANIPQQYTGTLGIFWILNCSASFYTACKMPVFKTAGCTAILECRVLYIHICSQARGRGLPAKSIRGLH